MRWARLLACLLVLAASVACHTDDNSGSPVLNRCAQSFECTKPDTCDPDLGICARPGVLRSYSAVLQVVPNNVAGSPVLRRVTLPPVKLEPSTNYNMGVIRVQRVVTVAGSVVGTFVDNQKRALEAEVAFAPSMRSYLVDGVSAFTLPDASGAQRFSATLDPGTTYDVTVFPTAKDSELFPPAKFVLPATSGNLDIKLDYPPQGTLSAKLLDENKKPADKGWKVRLRRKGTGEITSSLGRVQEGGVFQIRAPAEMLTPAALAEQEVLLEVGKRGDPALVSIAFAGERLREGGTLVMPTIPAPVLYSCKVEVGEGKNLKAIRADLTFESSFPLPTESGDVRGRDWCRLRLPGSPQGTFTCGVTLTASVGPGPDFQESALLLPGDYQVFVAPNGDANDRLRVATSNFQETISTQPNGMQAGKAFPASPATRFEGAVLSPQSRPMPAVTVIASALGIQRDLAPVALYNRTAEQRSDPSGTFNLAVDIGFFDLLAQPPRGSGYAWVVNDNRRIASLGETMDNRVISPRTPVVSKGRLLTEDNKPVVDARVDMFALVDNLDPAQGGQRAVRIATTTSNTSGDFWLLLPQQIGEDDGVVPGLDGGVHVGLQGSDAGGQR